MEGTILRSKVMREIDSGVSFDMIFITADRRRGTGGKIISLKQWKKMNEAAVEAMPGRNRKAAREMIKDPNHWANKTINVFNPLSKHHPHKVHFRLIQFFNGKRVING